jgi:hypothetical protein
MLFSKLNELIRKLNQDDVYKNFKVEFLSNTMSLASPNRVILGATSLTAEDTTYSAQKTTANIGMLLVLKLDDNLATYDDYLTRLVKISSEIFDLFRVRDVDVRVNLSQKLIYIFVGVEAQYISNAW